MKKSKHFLSANDLEVQISRMVAFIEHEARERAEEIDSKSDGEFVYEKGRLIHRARKEMHRIYEKKEKNVLRLELTDAAMQHNQARLRELACREAHIAKVEAEVQDRLLKSLQDLEKYRPLLLDMIVQGILRLLERRVDVRAREEDESLVESLLEPAAQRYKEMIGSQIKLQIDRSRFLPPSCLGGVELAVPSRKVRVINTFHSRLQLIVRHLVPAIRKQLFDN